MRRRRCPEWESKPSTQHPHRTHRSHDMTDQRCEIVWWLRRNKAIWTPHRACPEITSRVSTVNGTHVCLFQQVHIRFSWSTWRVQARVRLQKYFFREFHIRVNYQKIIMSNDICIICSSFGQGAEMLESAYTNWRLGVKTGAKRRTPTGNPSPAPTHPHRTHDATDQ